MATVSVSGLLIPIPPGHVVYATTADGRYVVFALTPAGSPLVVMDGKLTLLPTADDAGRGVEVLRFKLEVEQLLPVEG